MWVGRVVDVSWTSEWTTNVTCVEWFVIWFVYKCTASCDKWCGIIISGNNDGGGGMLFWKVSDWWLQVWKERKWHQSINNVTNILLLYNRSKGGILLVREKKMLVVFCVCFIHWNSERMLPCGLLWCQLNTGEFLDKIALFICRRLSHSNSMMLNMMLNHDSSSPERVPYHIKANCNYLKSIMKWSYSFSLA